MNGRPVDRCFSFFFDVVRAALLACLLPCSVRSFARVSELVVWPGPATSEGFEERGIVSF